MVQAYPSCNAPCIAKLTSIIEILSVPEHFSTPLHMSNENGYFTEAGVEVELVCCPGGTGEVSLR